ncbi:GIY-YIG nuclease family protein [Paenibacillus sp. Lou8.1]|uniref:GIY-YIG nuclease family protein n=1 Tax=Paenibacillus sp. Lou8.1 TaxID=2962041 RepID=UPI0020B8BC03|nr:GIY-YIG nuclease family protein [Paenibacillus sp. Lou8.1]MCP3807737.1 GIY-YIG nuclease family protein [Paenibacillus sp. Lou8.1]
MSNGYVYILINESFKGLIKIGKTSLSSSERAKQLSSNTGIPTPFKVAYEVFSTDCNRLEKAIHNELNDFRVNANREFFSFPLYKAIELIQKFSERKTKYNEFDSFEAIEILPKIRELFNTYINPFVSSVRVYQTSDRVYLEVTQDHYIAGYLKHQLIRRTDLGYLHDGPHKDDKPFKPERSINANAEVFLSSGFTTMALCSDDLFTAEGMNKMFNDE